MAAVELSASPLILSKHDYGIASLAFSRDGKMLASAEDGGTGPVRLWDATTGNLIRTFKGDHGGNAQIAFSPDNTLLAIGLSFEEDKNSVGLWEVGSGELSDYLNGLERTYSIAFSPDGTMLAAGGNQGAIIWNVITKNIVTKIEVPGRDVDLIAFSPDSKKIATSNHWGNILLWDVQSGAAISKLVTSDNSTRAISFSPDGKELTAVGDKGIHVWNVLNSQYIGEYPKLYKWELKSFAYSPDGKQLVSGGDVGETILWDVAAKTSINSFNGKSSIKSLAFSPDGMKLAAGESLGYVRIYSINSLPKFNPNQELNSLQQLAVLRNETQSVKELLSKGADISAKDKYGRDAITQAFESNFVMGKDDIGNRAAIIHDIVEEKGVGSNISAEEIVSRSRKKALSKEQKQIIETLLDAGAKIKTEAPKVGEFVSDAMASHNIELLKKLIRAGLNINTNIGSQRLLEFAVTNNNFDFVNYLITNGANVNFQTTRSENLVFLAVDDGLTNIAKHLLKKGVKLPDVYTNAVSALNSWKFSEYSSWLNRGNIIGLLNTNQKNQLETIRIKENSLYLAEQARLAQQARLAEQARNERLARIDYIIVTFDVVAGFSTEGVDREFMLVPAEGNYTQVEVNASKNGASIYKDFEGNLSGNYLWSAHWDDERKFCSGTIHVSGMKRNVDIRVYSDCSDAGIQEY